MHEDQGPNGRAVVLDLCLVRLALPQQEERHMSKRAGIGSSVGGEGGRKSGRPHGQSSRQLCIARSDENDFEGGN